MTFKIKDGLAVGGTTFVDASRNITINDITLTGQIKGPATLTIDPEVVGDNTGTVLIKGNLQIDGTGATFNSININSPGTDASLINATGITAWNYSGKSFSVSAQETGPLGVFFKPDGTKMYITGSTGDDVNEYNLSTPWNVSTASFVAVSTGITQDTAPEDLSFKNDGLTLFVLGSTNDTVYQYTLSVAWDITTATYASKSFSVTSQDTSPTGLWMKPDGTTMYITGTLNDRIYQYTLSTPWDISTASYSSISFVISQESNPQGVALSNDGTKMWIVGTSGDDINEYTLGTAWNISTASFVNNFYLGFQETSPAGIYVDSTAENRVYIVGTGSDRVYQYNTQTNSLAVNTDQLYISNNATVDGNFVVSSNAYVDGTLTSPTLSAGTTTVTGTLTATSNLTLSGTTTATGNFGNSITTGNISMGTGQTTGTFIIGGTAQTGALTVGQSTGAQTLNLGTGATTNTTTKTINIGTAGVSGSITNVNIGSAVSGATGTITFSSGGTQMAITNTASAVNYTQMTGAITGSGPTISAQGSDTNINLNLTTKGTGLLSVNTGGGTQFRVVNTSSAVNYFQVNGGATGVQPGLRAEGSDTNIGTAFTTKGTGSHFFSTNGFAQTQFVVAHTASAVNYVQVTGGVAGNTPIISIGGSDANSNLAIRAKGSGGIFFQPNSLNQLAVASTPSAVNYVQVTGAVTGSRPTISVQGTDTNISIDLTPKGSGAVVLGGNILIGGSTDNGTDKLQVTGSASISTALGVTGPIKQSQISVNGNSATTTLDFNTSGNFYITLSLNTTLAFSNLSSNIGSSGYIFLKQNGTGGYTVGFPAQAKTPGGRTFTQVTAANSLSLITFYVVDANTVIVNYIADFK